MDARVSRRTHLFNYKKTFRIVLMVVCDADYQFTLVDVGDAGRQSDVGVYRNSKLGFAIDNQLLGFPWSEILPSTEYNLRIQIMKLFSY